MTLRLVSLFAFGAVLLAGCAEPPPQGALSGQTMGTTWTVRWTGAAPDQAELTSAIEGTLAAVNASMSTWDPRSTLSLVNRAAAGDWHPIEPMLLEVLQAARDIGAASDGAFDVTIGPLVRLWGFGPDGDALRIPEPANLAAARAVSGLEHFELREEPPAVRKRYDATEFDLSGIAKGYGVDAIAAELTAAGLQNFMVEIGGEVRARGLRPDGTPWRIGIEQPDPARRALGRVIALQDAALATSGDYRNFFELDGRRFSHALDPTTARPIEHALASVTVLAATCMEADAWATALLVLGPDKGLAMAERLGLAALFLVRDEGGEGWTSLESTAFTERPGDPK